MGGEGHDQTGGIDQCKGGSFLFPITPVFNSSLQYSHNQSISLISKPQDQGTVILSPSTPLAAIYDRAPHTTHKHPQQASQFQRSPTNIVDDIQPPNFSINHRSPWLVTTPIIDLGLDSLGYISCIPRYVMPAYTSRQHQARVSEDLLIENDASPRTVNLTRTNKRSIACGGEFKVTLR